MQQGEEKCPTLSVEKLFNTIKDAPTIDAVLVTRCKDCNKREYCRTSTVWAVAPNEDWYCADGERKEDIIEAIRKEVEAASERCFKNFVDNFDEIVK